MSRIGSRSELRETDARFRRYRRERDPADRAALVERFTPLARSLASRYRSGGEREDIMQVAYIGLLKAIERYDPDRGIAFSSFAVPTILGEIKRYFRDQGWAVRAPRDVQELSGRADRVTDALTGELGRMPTVAEVAERCDVTPEQVLEARASATAHRAISLDQPAYEEAGDAIVDQLTIEESGFALVEDGLALEQRLAGLPQRERSVVVLRFRDELKQREIGEHLGMSQMQVSRLLAKALTTLAR
jgi:RNA polymerase sigma-B factor